MVAGISSHGEKVSVTDIQRFIIEWDEKFWSVVDRKIGERVNSFSTRDQAEELCEKLNEEKGW